MENHRILRERVEGNTIKLTDLHELLDDKYIHWSLIIRKSPKLKMLRDIFKRKMKRNLNYHHMSTFLLSSDNIRKVYSTVVVKEIDELSKTLMSSRNIFELRKLKAKRKINTLKDCYIYEEEAHKTILHIFEIFSIEKYIGFSNCQNILNWVLKVLNDSNCHEMSNFVYKEAAFARAFRSKLVMPNQSPSSKRTTQIEIIHNFRGALCWWTLAVLKQIITPVRKKDLFINCWRYGYLKILKREMKDFKEQYKVERLNDYEIPRNIKPSSISTLRLTIIENKLRPILRRKPLKKMLDCIHWKKVNSVLTWFLERSGVTRSTIRDSCEVLRKFLTEKSHISHVHAYTADIAKCFSTVKHHVLMSIIERLLEEKRTCYVACGKGKSEKGYFQLLICTAESKKAVLEALAQKMKYKKVPKYVVSFTTEYSTQWLLTELSSTISSYYYKRGESIFRLRKGVPQGHPVSSNFALMYLNGFESNYWKKEKGNPRIAYCRYEDDYIFLTTRRNLFKKMIEPLFTGRNSYQLKANPEKSKTSEDRKEVEWCKTKIDMKNAKFYTRKKCRDGVRRYVELC